MKILMVTYSSEFCGGANRSFLSVVKGLKENGNDVEVIIPQPEGELNNELDNLNIKWYYCKYYRMGARPFNGVKRIISYAIVYAKFIQQYFASKKLLNIIKEKQYDVIYTNTILPYVGLFAAKKLNLPSVIHDREPLDGTKVPQIKAYERFIYNRTNKIIVISSDLKSQWERRKLGDKVKLILNGIPIEKNIVISNQDINNSFNVLLTGRMQSTKRHMDALNALILLKNRKLNNIKLFFAGSVDESRFEKYKKDLEKFIKDNNLENDVTFCGEVKNMAELRRGMNVELMCNPNEPFGRVTVEGMRSGLVVIGINSGGTKDIIIDNENGLLYENCEDLANKIEYVYKNENYRKELAKKAYEYSQTHFTVEENVNKIEQVLQSVL